MSTLLTSFTYDRNAYLRTAQLSAQKVAECISLVQTEAALDKTSSNKIAALASTLGIFVREGDKFKLTELAKLFLGMYEKDEVDAWQWILTRSLALHSVPNGTSASVNETASALGIGFNFFDMVLRVLVLLQSQSGKARFLGFDELCEVLKEDTNWKLESDKLFLAILEARRGLPPLEEKEGLLDELETKYGIPRDNLSGVFHKSFEQTGLFEYAHNSDGKGVGIALRRDLDVVLQGRLRYLLDHPTRWESSQEWPKYLELRAEDLPQEVSKSVRAQTTFITPKRISDLVPMAAIAMTEAGFRIEEEHLRRFVASLMAKRFVILSGLSGSGKSKIAQLLAMWMDEPEANKVDPFLPGTRLVSERVTYQVVRATPSMVELENVEEGGGAVPLPRDLIQDWADTMEQNGFSESTKAESIREAAKRNSKYANFIHGFASHLKVCALRLLSARHLTKVAPRYLVLPVEADWNSSEDLFGYPDALDATRYVRKPALDLVLRAADNFNSSGPTYPYFLILDEMNLAHVERYFASMLSSIESGEPIVLHGDRHPRDGVPSGLAFPPNLFVIGTINVDETTYLFSPKVLDRANVLEFRVSKAQMANYLCDPIDVNLQALVGKGMPFSELFASEARKAIRLDEQTRGLLSEEMQLAFAVLAEQEAEFGFRPTKEIARFLFFHQQLTNGLWEFRNAWDAQVVQKILPKLHGSQRKMEPILRTLALLSHDWRVWRETAGSKSDAGAQITALESLAKSAADPRRRELDPLAGKTNLDELLKHLPDGEIKKTLIDSHQGRMDTEVPRFSAETAFLPLTHQKIIRMMHRLQRDGFVSFAEA